MRPVQVGSLHTSKVTDKKKCTCFDGENKSLTTPHES